MISGPALPAVLCTVWFCPVWMPRKIYEILAKQMSTQSRESRIVIS